jgi:hypothetical protein
MSSRLFQRLRRCRALFALALCAWLTLASVAWAQESCCASKGAAMSMVMPHALGTPDHGPGHAAPVTPDCSCVHVTASVPALLAQNLPQSLPRGELWQAHREVAPQPVYEPPLRPPVV